MNEFGLIFCVNTCDAEIQRQVYFILYRISLTGLIKFYRRISQIQNDFFYIEPLAITHKAESMEPEIPENEIFLLKSEISVQMELIKNSLQEIITTQKEEGIEKDTTGKTARKSYLKFISYLIKQYNIKIFSLTAGKIKEQMETMP